MIHIHYVFPSRVFCTFATRFSALSPSRCLTRKFRLKFTDTMSSAACYVNPVASLKYNPKAPQAANFQKPLDGNNLSVPFLSLLGNFVINVVGAVAAVREFFLVCFLVGR
jgi:hypothetical protein